ncbi:MAG: HupE/UreJ family protein, partial [Rhodospirillaceae bacterium]|nr:HupE/UreJ family protein [Rhodospirillaceae bacterium]
AALAGPVYAEGFEVTYVGDTVVDAELIYPTGRKHTEYTLRSTLDPGLPKQDETANLILDYATDPPLVFRIRGLIAKPVTVSRSVLEAAWTFVVEGVRHILEGLDHVLFVVCLVLGATALGSLAWRVTGFTLGHSVTLTLGFFGYYPSGAWFVPLVETGIALSIVYAAVAALTSVGHRLTTGVTALLGLLHGLGFSFVLREILKLDSPNLWQSLLAFNLGIEAGQLLIVLVLWPLLFLVAKRLPRGVVVVRWAIALPCVLVAAIWTGERAVQLISTL